MEQQLLFYERNGEEIKVNIISRIHGRGKGVQVHGNTYMFTFNNSKHNLNNIKYYFHCTYCYVTVLNNI